MQTPYEMTPTRAALCLSPKRLGCQRMRQLCALVREYLIQKLEKEHRTVCVCVRAHAHLMWPNMGVKL